MLFVVQISLVLGQNVASTAFIEDPFGYQNEYKLDPTKLTADENSALPYVQECAKSYGISPALIMAIINHESTFNSNAVGDGGLAIGYMQLHWDAAYDAGYRSSRGETKDLAKEDWPTDGLDPDANVRYGCEYLGICHRKCSNSDVYAGDTLKNTLSSYNQGWPHGPDKVNEDTYVNPIISSYDNYKEKIMYHVDMGDLDDEYSHNLAGWGDLQAPPDNPYVSPSGDKTKRYQTLHEDNSVDFSLKKIGIPYVLMFEVEDGNCDDSFEVWIGGNNLGDYKGKSQSPTETKSYEVIIPKEYITDSKVTITFKNKASDNCGLAAVYNVKLIPQQETPAAVDAFSIGTAISSSDRSDIEQKAKANINNELDKTKKSTDSYRSLFTSLGGSSEQSSRKDFDFSYQITGAKFCTNKVEASSYMASKGIQETEQQGALSAIDTLGLEKSGFCIVAIDCTYTIFGTVTTMKYPIICNELGDPYWESWQLYGKLNQFMSGTSI